MAYINQEKKKVIVARVKQVLAELKKEGVVIKATYRVSNYSAIVMNISAANIDLVEADNLGYVQVNEYQLQDHYSEKVAGIYTRIFRALHADNYDNSDSMVDYFDVGYYVRVNTGSWDKPFTLLN